VIKVEPEKLLVKLSLRESDLAAGDVAVRRTPPELPWDYAQELADKAAAQKDKVAAELFKPMMLKVHELLRHNKCRGRSREALVTSLPLRNLFFGASARTESPPLQTWAYVIRWTPARRRSPIAFASTDSLGVRDI